MKLPPLMSATFVFLLAAVFLGTAHAGTLTWTGAVNSTDFFNEGNWDLDGGGAPPAGTVDSGSTIAHDVNITSSSIFTGHNGGGGIEPNSGNPWVITDSSVTLGAANPGSTTHGQNGIATIDLYDTSLYSTGWTTNMLYTVHDDSTLQLRNNNTGSGALQSNATVDLVGNGATVHFTRLDETQALVDLGQILVEGQAPIVGDNLLITSDGDTGSFFTAQIAVAVVPEPASIFLWLLLSGMCLGYVRLRRQKDCTRHNRC